MGKLSENGIGSAESIRKYAFGEFLLDPMEQRLLRRGEAVALRNRPFQVLLYLVANRGRLVEQSELLAAIWGAEDVYHDAMRKAVGSARAALGEDTQQPRYIETHWGKGYRFIGDVVELDAAGDDVPLRENKSLGLLSARQSDLESPRSDTVPPIQKPAWRRQGPWPAMLLRFALSARTTVTFACIAMATLLLGAGSTVLYEPTIASQRQTAVQSRGPSSGTAQPPEPHQAEYLEAQYLLSQRGAGDIERAVQMFQKTAQLNPHSGDAYAGLAECYALGYWGFWKIDPALAGAEAAKYARLAVAADPFSAYAHAQLAAALLRDLKIEDAQAEFERALSLRPDDAEVHHAYAVFLDDTRRAGQGIEEMKRAIELQPLSLAYKTDLGMSYYYANRYAEAVAVYQSVLKLDPGYLEAHEYLASMYVFTGQWRRAESEYARIDRLRGAKAAEFQLSAVRIVTLLKTGKQQRVRDGIRAMLASPSLEHVIDLAEIDAQLGRPEESLRYLRQIASSHSLVMFNIPEDPLLAPLHGNPEYEALRRQVLISMTAKPELRSPANHTAENQTAENQTAENQTVVTPVSRKLWVGQPWSGRTMAAASIEPAKQW